MGLSACMWTSVSGLLSHGQKMNVVGNNLANVSTIGFKAQRMDFEDYLYVDKGTASGTKQIGEGASVYTILGDFSQGAFESTNSGTDLAIDGNGFFQVRQKGTQQKYYTRAGDFYFNVDRELQNPEGLVVQGWKVNNRKSLSFSTGTAVTKKTDTESPYIGYGTPTDIVLDSWNIVPQQTTNVTIADSLVNDNSCDKTTSKDYPLSALFEVWDGRKDPPMADEAYATQTSVDVYDEGGTKHTLTTYMDKVNVPVYDTDGKLIYDIDGLPAGYSIYEYLVTIPPSEDMRSYGGTYNAGTGKLSDETKFFDPTNNNTAKTAGVLMSGVLIFNGAGQLMTQTAYTYGAQDTAAATHPNEQCKLNPDDPASWQPTKFSSNGLPVFTANFTGQPLANSVSEMVQKDGGTPYSQAQDYIIELDFGLHNSSNKWDAGGSLADIATKFTSPDTDALNSIQAQIEANLGTTLTISDVAPSSTGAVTTAQLTLGSSIGGAKEGSGSVTNSSGLKYNYTYSIAADGDTGTLTIRAMTDGTVNYEKLATMSDSNRSSDATANNGSSFITDVQADGYASGILSNYNIDNNGVIYGIYNNGESLPLYQLSLYDFHNNQGLYREGGNLFSKTKESGEPRQGVAGDGIFGSVRAYNIEQSNVDMSTEFVHMISTQRGFQANSKCVTTVDTMLETVIGMKR